MIAEFDCEHTHECIEQTQVKSHYMYLPQNTRHGHSCIVNWPCFIHIVQHPYLAAQFETSHDVIHHLYADNYLIYTNHTADRAEGSL